MNTIQERKLFFAWNMDKEKQYLEQKSKEGLHLVHVGLGRYEFIQGEPKDYVYQFDFQVIHKVNEKEYLELFQDWELVQRFGSWFYFRKERDGINDSIYSNVESVRGMFLRLLGLLTLVGFPLYYQAFIMFPTLASGGELGTFYYFFIPFIYIISGLHLFALIKIMRMIMQLNKEIRE